MPQPAAVDVLVAEIAQLFRAAEDAIEHELRSALEGSRRARRLRELRQAVDAEIRFVQTQARRWLSNQLPVVYELGAAQAAIPLGDRFVWTQAHLDAVTVLAQDTFDDVLSATRGVDARSKRMLRQLGRRQTTLSLIEGRTAQQAGRRLARRAAAGVEVDGRIVAATSVTYADGSHRRIGDYADMLLRTKTALAFNAGTLNQTAALGTGFVEVFDGIDCGATGHNDPDKANGQVWTIEKARGLPVAHPRCRRSFGPRPDVTSEQQAQRAEPSTTPEQRADQAEFERSREERMAARRRPRRGPRAPRAARTPRRATTGRESGDLIPVSHALDNRTRRRRLRGDIDEAIATIDGVHGDGPLPRVPIHSIESQPKAALRRGQGLYQRHPDTQAPVQIAISGRAADDQVRHLTVAHEVGHFLDHHAIGASGLYASEQAASGLDDIVGMSEWWETVNSSEAVRVLRDLPDSGHLEYLLRPREIWARSYSQWIATRSGSGAMRDGVEVFTGFRAPANADPAEAAMFRHFQWTDDDFAATGDSIDALMARLGWRQ